MVHRLRPGTALPQETACTPPWLFRIAQISCAIAMSKYPPAEPGALDYEPLKAAVAASHVMWDRASQVHSIGTACFHPLPTKQAALVPCV
jgi:hypothetical protein